MRKYRLRIWSHTRSRPYRYTFLRKGCYTVAEKFIRDRITSLRIKKGVSEYRMSYDMGHSSSYIRSISSGRALPSMGEFLYMCEYFGITPRDFFDEDIENPALLQEAIDGLKALNDQDLRLILGNINRLRERG
jgi:transcriptional regulator with XRE-family HTH domain